MQVVASLFYFALEAKRAVVWAACEGPFWHVLSYEHLQVVP